MRPALLPTLALLLWTQSHAATLTMTPQERFPSMLAQLSAGDTLLLRGGVYPQSLDLCEGCYPALAGTPQRWTTIAAAPGETVTIRPGLRIAGTAGTPYRYISFDRLRFDATGAGYAVSWSATYAEHVRIQDGEVFGGSRSGISGMSPYGEVLRNTIHHNGDSRLSHGLYICPQYARIEGNDIYANSGYGLQLYSPGHHGCSTGTRILGNVIHDNLGDGGVIMGGGEGIVFCGNVVTRNHGGGIRPIGYGSPNTHIQVIDNTIEDNQGIAIRIAPEVTGTLVRGNRLRNNQGTIDDQGTGTSLDNNTPDAPGASTGHCASAVLSEPQRDALVARVTTDVAARIAAQRARLPTMATPPMPTFPTLPGRPGT